MHRKYLILALELLALGAFLLHYRIHPIWRDNQLSIPGLVAAIVIALDMLLVPYWLSYKETAAYGFLLNGMIAILGSIIMLHFSLATLEQITPANLIFKSTLPDVLMAAGDFLISKIVFDSYFE